MVGNQPFRHFVSLEIEDSKFSKPHMHFRGTSYVTLLERDLFRRWIMVPLPPIIFTEKPSPSLITKATKWFNNNIYVVKSKIVWFVSLWSKHKLEILTSILLRWWVGVWMFWKLLFLSDWRVQIGGVHYNLWILKYICWVVGGGRQEFENATKILNFQRRKMKLRGFRHK